jgi:hypothetical protein
MQASKHTKGALLLAILLGAMTVVALIKAIHHSPAASAPSSAASGLTSSIDTLFWRAQQLLSYSWVRITNPPKYGTLRWEVQQAKLKGARDLRSGMIACGSDFRDPQTALQEALSLYGIAVVELIEKNTYADEYRLRTWYKFKVIETLSLAPLVTSAGPSISIDPPKESLPIAADEVVILEDGGSMYIDGFKVTEGSNYSVNYLPSQKYLIFLQIDFVKRTGYSIGPKGVFTVSGPGELRPVSRERSALHEYIQTNDQNSLDILKADIRSRLASKK